MMTAIRNELVSSADGSGITLASIGVATDGNTGLLAMNDTKWNAAVTDNSTVSAIQKLFSGSKYDLMVVVLVAPDGSVFWNMMQRGRKGMNGLRIGELAHEGR